MNKKKLTKSKAAGTNENESQSSEKPLAQTSIVASFRASSKAEADAVVDTSFSMPMEYHFRLRKVSISKKH